jgi:hypothetical protein
MEYALILILIILALYLLHIKSDELTLLYFLLLALPFSVVFVRIVDKNYDWAGAEHDFYRQAAFDPGVMNTVFLVGFVSIMAFFVVKVSLDLSILRGMRYLQRFPKMPVVQYSTTVTIAILFLALYLNSFSARTFNIFDYGYGEMYDPPGSGGSYIIGYTLLLLIALKNSKIIIRKKVVELAIWVALIYEIIFHQLLVGSRESIGLIAAFYVIYKYRFINNNEMSKLKNTKRVLLIMIALFLSLGAFRSILGSNPDAVFSQGVFSIFYNNPWNASLLSVLGFSDQFLKGEGILFFSYYEQLLLKIPPQLITSSLYLDLIDSKLSDPGHWYPDYTTGGAYYPIVLLRSFGFVFGTIGLILMFILLMLASKLILSYKLYGQLLYLVLLMVSFRWMWYGDIDLVRGIQAWLIVCALDCLLSAVVLKKPI